MLGTHWALTKRFWSLKSLSDPGDGAAIIWTAVAAYAQREKRAIGGFTPANKCFSLEVALITVPTTHRACCSSAPPMPKGAGSAIPERGVEGRGGQNSSAIPVQFQEGLICLGWQPQGNNYMLSTVLALVEDRMIHKLWPWSLGDLQ